MYEWMYECTHTYTWYMYVPYVCMNVCCVCEASYECTHWMHTLQLTHIHSYIHTYIHTYIHDIHTWHTWYMSAHRKRKAHLLKCSTRCCYVYKYIYIYIQHVSTLVWCGRKVMYVVNIFKVKYLFFYFFIFIFIFLLLLFHFYIINFIIL